MNKQQAKKRRGVKTKAIIRNGSRPRLVVFRSLMHIYAHIVVPDEKGDRVITSASTRDKQLRPTLKGNKVEQSFLVGKLLAERALEKEVKEIAFDRSGNKFHGRVKALANGAREAGLVF